MLLCTYRRICCSDSHEIPLKGCRLSGAAISSCHVNSAAAVRPAQVNYQRWHCGRVCLSIQYVCFGRLRAGACTYVWHLSCFWLGPAGCHPGTRQRGLQCTTQRQEHNLPPSSRYTVHWYDMLCSLDSQEVKHQRASAGGTETKRCVATQPAVHHHI